MDNLSLILWICAISGSFFFSIRILMSLIFGLDNDLGGMQDLAADHGDSTDFKLVSFYTIFAFLMMFGWSGLSAYQQFELTAPISVLLGSAIGLITMFTVAYLFFLFSKFRSSGDTFTAKNAVGLRGSIYESIHDGNPGVVRISYGGLLREIPAISEDGSTIESFVEVDVCALVEPNLVSVKRVIDK